jgi:hypothetical protein
VECTTGYETTTAYRGICFEIAEVEEFLDLPGPAGDVTRRERWRKFESDGRVRSEAPGIFVMLAQERQVPSQDVADIFAGWSHWLNNGKSPP